MKDSIGLVSKKEKGMKMNVMGVVLSNGAERDDDVLLREYCWIESVSLKKETNIITSYFQFRKILKSMKEANSPISRNLDEIYNKLHYSYGRNRGDDVKILFKDLAGIDFALFQRSNSGEVILTHVL